VIAERVTAIRFSGFPVRFVMWLQLRCFAARNAPQGDSSFFLVLEAGGFAKNVN